MATARAAAGSGEGDHARPPSSWCGGEGAGGSGQVQRAFHGGKGGGGNDDGDGAHGGADGGIIGSRSVDPPLPRLHNERIYNLDATTWPIHKGSQLPLLRAQLPTIAQRCHGGARQTEELRASGSTAHKRALCGCERAGDVCDVLCDLLRVSAIVALALCVWC